MSVIRDNIIILNPDGDDADGSRTTSLIFKGVVSNNTFDIDEVLTGLTDLSFTGVGKNDLTMFVNGETEDIVNEYKVVISQNTTHWANGTARQYILSGTKTRYYWYKDGVLLSGNTSNGGEEIFEETNVLLDNNVYINFASSVGHDIGDYWTAQTVSSNSTLLTGEMNKIVAQHDGSSNNFNGKLVFYVNSNTELDTTTHEETFTIYSNNTIIFSGNIIHANGDTLSSFSIVDASNTVV